MSPATSAARCPARPDGLRRSHYTNLSPARHAVSRFHGDFVAGHFARPSPAGLGPNGVREKPPPVSRRKRFARAADVVYNELEGLRERRAEDASFVRGRKASTGQVEAEV